jgi:hypothetical protein
LVPLVVDCGDGDGDGRGEAPALAAGPCQGALRGQCGAACAGDDACPAGLFCGDGACTAQCAAGAGCDAGLTCSPRGRCVTSGGETGSGFGGGPVAPPSGPAGGGGSGAGGGGNCPDVSVAFQPINPAVMLVVDRSNSMLCTLGSATEASCGGAFPTDDSRWLQLKAAALSVIDRSQGEVIFGATFFPEGEGDCDVAAVAPTDLKLDNAAAIKEQYGDRRPGGATPTGEAIAAAAKQLAAADNGLTKETPKFLLLVTDGDPSCGGEEVAQERAVKAATDAFAANVRTFVIGLGKLFSDDPIGQGRRARFQAVANAGAGLPPVGDEKAPVYQAENREALVTALEEVVNGVRPCSFDLDVALDDPARDAAKGVVKVNGKDVPFNETDGWRLTDPDTVEFVGSWCETIRKGNADVKATFPCGVKTTPSPNPPPPR